MPVIAIEVVLVFGGALLFGWWQLRSIKQDQAEAAAKEIGKHAAEDNSKDTAKDTAKERAGDL